MIGETMKPLHVTVLMGGPSAESEVSRRTGRAVVRALSEKGIPVVAVDMPDEHFWLPPQTDVVFVALHGTFGEDGTLQRILEERGVPYTGSGPDASALAFDKARAKAAFLEAGIPTPRAVVVDAPVCRREQLEPLALPVVVKPARQGSSVGVTVVRREAELEAACKRARDYDEKLVIEEFIPGRELTVGILGEQALPVVEIKPKKTFYSYEAKYTAGESEYLVPAPLDTQTAARAQTLAQRAHRCLGCRDYSRVDIRLDPRGRMFVLEVNTLPGFTDTSLFPMAARAANLSFCDVCVRLVEMARARVEPLAVAT